MTTARSGDALIGGSHFSSVTAVVARTELDVLNHHVSTESVVAMLQVLV